MSNTTQQSAPMPAHSITPPLPTSHSDMFLDMIQGRSITVIVGLYLSSRTYTLPIALLCVYSLYFRNQISNLSAIDARNRSVSKKRKISSSYSEQAEAEDEAEAKGETENPTREEAIKKTATDEGWVIRLPDVDPGIFSLFLKFIYKDSYPSNIDARSPTTHCHDRSSTATVKSATPFSSTTSALRQPSSSVFPTSSSRNSQARLIPSHPTIPMPRPPPPQGMSQIDSVPPSVHVWLLAQRLGAVTFMNHAISRIYAGIGVHFALTPSLMDHVWKETSPSPKLISQPSPSSSPSNPSPYTTVTTVLAPSPLRKLLLDVLVTHWPRPHLSNPNAVVLRSLSVSPNFSTLVKVAWDKLFEKHTDLRNEFIYGLQGGVQLMPVVAYFATLAPTGQSGMVKGGVAGSEFGKEHGRGGGQGENNVVVKEEKSDATNILASEKASCV